MCLSRLRTCRRIRLVSAFAILVSAAACDSPTALHCRWVYTRDTSTAPDSELPPRPLMEYRVMR